MKTTLIAIVYAAVIVACTFAIKANAQYGTTTIQTIGNFQYINRPGLPNITCQTIGNMTYCR